MASLKSSVLAAKRYAMADLMASQWTVQHLASRKPEDLITAYGVTLEQAERILRREHERRSTRSVYRG